MLIWHALSHAVRVEECPDGELVEDADLEEDIELAEVLRLLLFAVGVQLRCLGYVLASSVFIPVGKTLKG